MTVPEIVGQRVREGRMAAGMTQAELGSLVGVTRSGIAHLEAGVRDTTVSRLAAIAAVIKVDLRDVFGHLGAS